ncbi:bile acid:sodium symporter family protein [Saccharophagus degradans]|uniref:bile acid:sodium symporter family protein n=1 Tax=Saccharophagus degradans TaxID=86304 RepID=UPI0024781842|nr:bile acid:sodium symporter family protein [Saccharophagus degradans]WGO99695.1 bile acid:sodium symporter family protein [Saccharophagus degradans]
MDNVAVLAKLAPLFLAVGMFGMGLSMQVKDFKYLLKNIKPVVVGVSLQVLLLPALGFALAVGFSLDPVLAVGLMLLAASPGGPGSNLVSYLSRGDVALSIALTSVSSILAIVSVPLITSLALAYFQSQAAVSFSIAQMVVMILVVTLVPTFLGVFTAWKAPRFAARCEQGVKVMTLVFIILLVIATIVKEKATIAAMFSTLGLPLAVFCLAAVAISLLLTRLLGFSGAHRRTIAIEAGIQNPVMAVVVATTFLNTVEYSIPAAVYPVVMLTVSLMFIAYAQFGWAPKGLGVAEVRAD